MIHSISSFPLSNNTIEDDGRSEIDHRFLAISPASPLHTTIEALQWTLTPVAERVEDGPREQEQDSSIRLSPLSPAGQVFLRTFASQEHGRYSSHLPKAFDIRVVTAQAVTLDAIFVTVEKGLLEKFDEIQSKFGGGFQQVKNRRTGLNEHVVQNVMKVTGTPQERITTLVREGLSSLKIVHTGNIFALPLPPHPITHVRAAPGIVMDCQPVAQGIISAKTKIIVVHAGASQEKALQKLAPPTAIIEESLEDTAEDTTTDQFFSAAEDKPINTSSELDNTTEDESESEQSARDDSDEDSDSMDDMISLSAPGLPPQPAGTLSAMTSATPRPGQYRATGTHTPGSVFSASTARAGPRPGKVFRTEALLQRVPAEMLHPRPNSHEDDDSFVFVDTNILAKLGCFSGDWIRLEVAKNVSSFGFASAAFGALGGADQDDEPDFRTARVFGLPGLRQQKQRYTVDKTGERRSSFSQSHSMMPLSPALYLSPMLLANLSHAQFVKVGAMPKPPRTGPRASYIQRPPSQRMPPLAKEVSLARMLTPLTQDPALQAILFNALKTHFERRKRLVKIGDVIAIPIDEDLARITSSAQTEQNADEDQLLSKLNVASVSGDDHLRIAWFIVQSVDADIPSESDAGLADHDAWGGTVILDTTQTKLGVSGTSHQSVSESIESWSRYWLGLKPVPQSEGVQMESLTTTASLISHTKLPLERRIADLVTAATSPRAISLGLPPLAVLLHSTQRQVGKRFIAASACASVGVHTFVISGNDLLSENASTTGGGDVKTEGLLRVRAERAASCGPQQTALLIQDVDLLTADRMIPTFEEIIKSARVLVATTSKIDDVPAGLRSLFTHELEVNAPDENAREIILRNACLSTALPLSPNINLKNVALQTAALVAGDLLDVVRRACISRSERIRALAKEKDCNLYDVLISGGQSTTHLLPEDFVTAIAAARSTFSDAIGAPKIPTVTWSDVGGLASQKDAIMETISLPLTRPELFANGVRKRSGILFYGPPGTGKTLLAKAIATEFSLNFFSVKGPELLNMYIGESEANVRRVFQRARDARPCVVFFDELDSVAPKRGNQGDSGGVMDRIVSQLLAELDGMSGGGQDGEDGQAGGSGGGVFVIGATNRPDLLDPALLRPGRFDKMLYLGVADSHEAQVTILEALTRKFTLDRSVDLKRVAQRLPFTYTGADLYALCSDAMLKAITRKTKAVDKRVQEIGERRGEPISTGWFFDHAATPEDVEVVVNEDDFGLAQKELVGSVSAKELEHFERIRKLFEDMDVGAGSNVAQVNGVPASNDENVEHNAAPPPRPGLPTVPTTIRYNKGKQKETRHGKGKAGAGVDSEADAENDYGVPAINHSYTNGSSESFPHSIGKGKGKAAVHHFDDYTGDDEDLYE